MSVESPDFRATSPIRVGIVGCGRMGAVHARILGEMPGVTVCGVADTDLHRAERLAGSIPGARAFDTIEALLASAGIHSVHILTPPPTHAALCCTAMAAGCHVFVEKPMAVTRQEAMQMIDSARLHQRLLTVDHNNSFDPLIRQARARVEAGGIGELISVEIFHNSLPPEAPWVSRLPSGDWFNDLDHLLYLCEDLLGTVQSVQAMGVQGADGRVAELHVTARNARGWSNLTYSTQTSPFEIRLVLRGREGVIEIDLLPALIVERHSCNRHRWLRKGIMALSTAGQLIGQTARNAVRVLSGRERGWGGLRCLLDSYYAAIGTGGVSPVAMEDCLRIVELKEDILHQLHAGHSPET